MMKDGTSSLNGYGGTLKSSECGKKFVKLIPWTPEFQKKYFPWASVSGNIHILRDEIRAIVDIDTIDEKSIEEFAKQLKSKSELGVANPPPKFLTGS